MSGPAVAGMLVSASRAVLAQQKQECHWDGVGERDGETSCREVAVSCREGVKPWCQSRR